MWVVLGIGAIIMAMLNVIWTVRNKDARLFGYISISLTALTLCALYSADAKWVLKEDWSALMDVVPGMSRALWILTIISIAINSVSLFKKKGR